MKVNGRRVAVAAEFPEIPGCTIELIQKKDGASIILTDSNGTNTVEIKNGLSVHYIETEIQPLPDGAVVSTSVYEFERPPQVGDIVFYSNGDVLDIETVTGKNVSMRYQFSIRFTDSGGGSVPGDFPSFEKIEGVVEYNEIAKAVEVSTVEELKAYNGTAILKNYMQSSAAGKIVQNTAYNVLKIPVNPGDVIRDMTISRWRMPTDANSWAYACFYDNNHSIVGSKAPYIMRFAAETDSEEHYVSYLSLRENGHTVPEGASYVLWNTYERYYYGAEGSLTDARNGRTADIITVNADASLTAYDGLEILPDYVGVGSGNTETYYQATDDVRIPRYEDALGDIETALDNIIAAQESLIGGGM